MRAVLASDVRDALPSVSAPTLVVHNRDDWLVRVDHGRYLAEQLPDARLLERNSADHWPLPEPDLLDALERFVTGSRPGEADSIAFLPPSSSPTSWGRLSGSARSATAAGASCAIASRTAFGRHCSAAPRRARQHSGRRGARDPSMVKPRAIRCAYQIRDAVRHSGLDVRCGLHTGEITRSGDDVTGIAVHIGARVSAAAAPGEVLVTRTVRDLVAGSGIAFEERGSTTQGRPGALGAVRRSAERSSSCAGSAQTRFLRSSSAAPQAAGLKAVIRLR